MPKPTLRPGLAHAETILITDRLIVPEMADYFSNFAAMPPVFATAYLVAFVEWTCVRALADHLLDGEQTVGTQVDLSHDRRHAGRHAGDRRHRTGRDGGPQAAIQGELPRRARRRSAPASTSAS